MEHREEVMFAESWPRPDLNVCHVLRPASQLLNQKRQASMVVYAWTMQVVNVSVLGGLIVAD